MRRFVRSLSLISVCIHRKGKMHGRPRNAKKPDEAVSAAKAAQLRSLQDQLLQYHHGKIYTKEALEIGAKLVEVNPEHYTAWNFRKIAVENILRSETDPDAIKDVLNQELRVVESALRRNFKCYAAWHHRKWVLNKGFLSPDQEFRLLDQFQRLDSRNFHAWNYRRYVASLKNLSLEEELKFTTDMINTNFSNYSAWHNRSILLSDLLKQKIQGFKHREKVLTEEYELVHQAIFTDPDDQSGWFYHLWLLEQTVRPDSPVLIASWPPQGSDLIVSFENLSGGVLSPFRSVYSDKGVFPVVLYFNQAVRGVDSSAITIEYMFNKNEDLSWLPLSTDNSGSAQAWVTYLNFPDAKDLSKSYPVEVRFGHSHGIVTSSGCYYCHPSQFTFTVRLHSIDPEHSEVGSNVEMVQWKDDCFHDNERPNWHLSSIVSFDQLRIDEECEQKASGWHAETITNEIALFRELLSEMDSKIGKLTLARLLMAHDAMMSYQLPSQQKKMHSKEVLDLFIDLMKSDPFHSRYYKDEHSLVLMEQVTSTSDSLLRYCCQYNGQTPLCVHNLICLRLKNMSLSRIGFCERLLWVQMLDLSHNELHSIEGLEAMQLLSHLNLSNNKLRSLTALEPLRLLKSLIVLDISYNEIGAHSIDTTRYLCASPLSHSVGTDWNLTENVTNDVSAREYWEAVLIFRGLHLTQLDVVGNAIADERFKMLLSNVIPCLKWLDGEEVH